MVSDKFLILIDLKPGDALPPLLLKYVLGDTIWKDKEIKWDSNIMGHISFWSRLMTLNTG